MEAVLEVLEVDASHHYLGVLKWCEKVDFGLADEQDVVDVDDVGLVGLDEFGRQVEDVGCRGCLFERDDGVVAGYGLPKFALGVVAEKPDVADVHDAHFGCHLCQGHDDACVGIGCCVGEGVNGADV